MSCEPKDFVWLFTRTYEIIPSGGRLAALVHELAFLDGGDDAAFTLASGRQSRWFF